MYTMPVINKPVDYITEYKMSKHTTYSQLASYLKNNFLTASQQYLPARVSCSDVNKSNPANKEY